jgi:PAS domain S-box-containing protein
LSDGKSVLSVSISRLAIVPGEGSNFAWRGVLTSLFACLCSERNREHAKRSRIRKKFLLESLQQSVTLLKEENNKLKGSIQEHLGSDKAEELIAKASTSTEVDHLIASSSGIANKVLDDPDFSFIKALQTAQQNFVVTDPSLPDNPIVYASQGFLNLTGYSLDQILGRNCRFLQGPETDPKSVERIRKAIEAGVDTSVCLLNYRVDGTTFWNQFFIAALRDAAGNVTNFVGVQCKGKCLWLARGIRNDVLPLVSLTHFSPYFHSYSFPVSDQYAGKPPSKYYVPTSFVLIISPSRLFSFPLQRLF